MIECAIRSKDIVKASKKGIKNEHGRYPVWMSQRKQKKAKKMDKKKKHHNAIFTQKKKQPKKGKK